MRGKIGKRISMGFLVLGIVLVLLGAVIGASIQSVKVKNGIDKDMSFSPVSFFPPVAPNAVGPGLLAESDSDTEISGRDSSSNPPIRTAPPIRIPSRLPVCSPFRPSGL